MSDDRETPSKGHPRVVDDDAALRALLAAPHIDENGFSARVMDALPAPRRRRKIDRRFIAIAGGALAAGVCGAIGAGALQTSLPYGVIVPLAVVVTAVVWGLVEGNATV